MSKQRIEYLDVARGIGILLVVLGHNDFVLISPVAYQVVYSFHIPLFFFLSGYFMDAGIGLREFFVKRFNSLIKPYLFTLFLIYFGLVSFEKMGFRTAIGRLFKSLYGAGYYIEWTQLWFLPHLFVVSLYAYLFYVIARKINQRAVTWFLLVVTLWVSSFFLLDFYPYTLNVFGRKYELLGLPLSFDLILLSGFFFILGSEVRQTVAEKVYENWFLLIGSGTVAILLNYFSPYLIDFNTRTYENYIVNTVEAICGIFFVLALSRQIELRIARLASALIYSGRISLIILIFHWPIQNFWGLKILDATGSDILKIVVGYIMGVGGSILIYELFIRYNPVASWWFGRKADVKSDS